jgi:peroxiredoxin
MMSVGKKVKQIPLFAVALILALGILNLLLIRQNFGLRKQLNVSGKIEASANFLKPGEIMTTPFTGTDLKAQPYQMNYGKDGKRHLLLFFSPSCPYCVKQGPIWANLLNLIDSNRFEVVGIVGDREDKQKVVSHAESLGYFKTRLVLPVVSVSDEVLARYKLTATPTTLLIDNSGKVEHVWVGQWDQSKINEIGSAVDLKLQLPH